MREMKIHLENLINFDKNDFCVKCMKRQKILILIEMKKLYAMNLENRKSCTIIEMINVTNNFSFPSMIIMQDMTFISSLNFIIKFYHQISSLNFIIKLIISSNQKLMTSWFSNEFFSNTHIVISTSGFILEEIAIEFLKHYIQNSNTRPDADWKLMFMNNHETHLTSEFIALTNDNHIRLYPLISHLTHCMQSLDVGIFQPYKHWHSRAIWDAIAVSFIAYSINQFLRYLNKIRQNACKATNILHAFKNFEMWSINVKRCVELFKKFNLDLSQMIESQLSLLRQLNSLTAIETSLDE